MLPEPLEKELNLPPLMIQICHHHRTDIQSVSEEDELSLVHIVPADDPSYLVRILRGSQLTVHVSDSIGKNARAGRKTPGPFDRSEVIVLLAADDEVRSNTLDVIQSMNLDSPFLLTKQSPLEHV